MSYMDGYRYEKVEMEVSLKNNIFFSLKKIKKLYPLHLITMFFAIVASVVMMLQKGLRLKSIIWLGGEIVLNLTLLQTWVPYNGINVSLNGVAWYLSVTLFLYFMFPWIKRIIERKSIVKLCIICGIILFTEVVSCIPFITIFGNNSHVYLWFMYCFPVFRLGDFFIGCVLKRIFFESNVRNIEGIKATFFEVLAVVITVLVLICFNQEHSDVMLIALNNWTTIFIPLAAIWVLLFAVNKGIITKILSNKMAMFIGNISAYAFLIHYVITQYMLHLLSFMNIDVVGWKRVILVFFELVVSIGLSVLYRHFHERVITKLFRAKNKIVSQ